MEYLTANILGAIPVLFILLRRPDLARPMITIGLLAMPLTFFDLLYVPDYWVPKTLFEIPLGIEGFIFSFEAGALFAAFWGNLYPHIFGYRAVDRAAKRRPASKPAVA